MNGTVSNVTRRRVLRGMMNGGAVTVALPFLDCFLNGNGDAQASGAPLPLRFGTWIWGLGVTADLFVPKTVGPNWELTPQLASLKGYHQHVNLYTNFDVLNDGKPNICHYTGWVAVRSGEAPSQRGALARPSLDTLIADEIGGTTRFPLLSLAATGNPRSSVSFRSADEINPPDTTPIDFYQRVFGPEFKDPNSPNFTPDPYTMARKSALSAVTEQSAALRKTLGAADQARLDAYFTSLRTLENRMAIQLEKPAPAEACKLPGAPKEVPVGVDVEVLGQRHSLMVDLAVMALACNQTHVVNLLYSDPQADTTRNGESRPHHAATHEEPMDVKTGYQLAPAWFLGRAFENWSYFVKAMADFKEGDASLLDRSLIFANSDSNLARIHQIQGLPMMTAGSAGGALKTGVHVDGKTAPATLVGFTAMRAMGLRLAEWGAGSMKVTQSISEVVA